MGAAPGRHSGMSSGATCAESNTGRPVRTEAHLRPPLSSSSDRVRCPERVGRGLFGSRAAAAARAGGALLSDGATDPGSSDFFVAGSRVRGDACRLAGELRLCSGSAKVPAA